MACTATKRSYPTERSSERTDSEMRSDAEPEPALSVRLPRMLNSVQVAHALGVNRSTLSRWRAQGVGPRVYWLGKACPRYREDDVLEWLERNAA